jgi:hypothetical protein
VTVLLTACPVLFTTLATGALIPATVLANVLVVLLTTVPRFPPLLATVPLTAPTVD